MAASIVPDQDPDRDGPLDEDIACGTRLQDALQDSRSILKAMVEGTSDTVYVKDLQGRYLLINSAGASFLCKTEKEVLGRDDHALFSEDAARAIMAQDRDVLSSGEGRTFEQTGWVGGVLRTFLSTKGVFRDAHGHVLGLIGISHDITERKQADQELRRQARLNEALFNQAITGFVLMDRDLRFIRVNEAFARRHGKQVADFPGRTHHEVFSHELPADTERALREVLVTRRSIQVAAGPYMFPGPAERGTTYSDWILQPLLDEQGEVEFLFFSSIDVTERKQAEEALRESEQRYREVFNYSSDCIFLVDVTQDGRFRFVEVNPADEKTIGYASTDVAGKLVEEALPAQSAAAFSANYRRCVEAGTRLSYEEDADLPAGRKSFHTTLIPVRDQGGRVHRLVGVARDITESKRAEQQLRASLREKDVLLKEVHHRVKNNLQLINSMFALQAGRIQDRAVAGVFTESQNRLRAMALVHENLYRSRDLALVRLAGHIEALCAYLYRSYGVDPERITLGLHIADVTLDLDRSIRCGLIVNELVSNALKHAFPGERPGRVTVRLEGLPGGCYTMVVGDDGVGLPPGLEPHRAESLGLQLVADLTEHLGGTLGVDRHHGTTFTVRFPGEAGQRHDTRQNRDH